MARTFLGTLLIGMVTLSLAPTNAHAGEDVLKKELTELNQLTGTAPMTGALNGLLTDPKHAKELLKYALPAAKKKELSYNAGLVLGLAAADTKDIKLAEAFLRVCMERAVKVQSFEKLQQSYILTIELYYEAKQYADCTRVCKELLELNTDDDKERRVISTLATREGVEFREPAERFDTAQRLRPYVREKLVKALAKQGKYERALEMVDGMLKTKGDWIDEHLKGWVLHEAGKLDEATRIYENVIKKVAKDDRLEAEEKDAYIERFRAEVSNIYIDLKKIDQATKHLEILLKKNPDSPIYYNDLGFVWADNDLKLDEAEKLIRKALDLDREQRKKAKNFNPKTDQDNGAYLDSLGWVLFKQKKTKEAKDWLLKAIEDKKSRHIEIYDHLGDVLTVLGEREAAIRAFEDGLKFVNDSRRDAERKAVVEKKLEKLKSEK